MDITPLVPKGRLIIERYGNGGFVIAGVSYEGNILILPDRVVRWGVAEFREATMESLQPLLTLELLPDLLLFGSGKAHMLLAADLRANLRGKNIAADAMDTGAACRTYNVLLAEERRIAAALIAV